MTDRDCNEAPAAPVIAASKLADSYDMINSRIVCFISLQLWPGCCRDTAGS